MAQPAHNLARPDADVRTPSLPPGPSLLLDVVRLLAAITVAVGHLSQNYFTTGWPPICMEYAHAAVAVFFVLSGFMIRYVTQVKVGTLRRYAIDRATRIYSVVLPTLALTIIFDFFSAHFSPAYYAINFSDLGRRGLTAIAATQALDTGFWLKSLIRVFLSLVMLSQSWFRDSSPLSDSPFWSVSYECVFYALFGITIYLRGGLRLAACVLVFLLTGPTVFLMYPLWLIGCASYDAFEHGLFQPDVVVRLIGLAVLCVAVVHGVPWVIVRTGATWFYFGRAVPTMDGVAIATALILPVLCRTLSSLSLRESHPAVRLLRRAAAATFPLYLIHFPLFVLLAASIPYPREGFVAKVVLLGSAFTLSVLLVGPCDRLKETLRKSLLA